jgi:erythromycin esterase
MHKLDQPADLDPLLEQIGDKKYVLLCESSHGTSEFYTGEQRSPSAS